ncbi:MAG TPA: hypothetical protein VLM79_14375, partial [Kofleriaceae bacterium]|nr:hypothetical protein [Kofleriaceae bacterium]
ARLGEPDGVAVDGTGNVYVADASNRTIRKITPAGAVTTFAGTPGTVGSADGTGAAASFYIPTGIAVDGAGNVYVTDTGNSNIRKITAEGAVSTLAGTAGLAGSADGVGSAARFNVPFGITVDGAGNAYVADQGNHTIRKITPAAEVTTLVGTPGSAGSADGTGPAALFNHPTGIAADGAGNLYVGDEFNSTIRKITAAGAVTTLAGTAHRGGSTDGTGAAARFSFPEGVAVDAAGNVFVADAFDAIIRKVTAAGVVTTLAGTASQAGGTDGKGSAARFFTPAGVVADRACNVFVADLGAIRKITSAGVVTTLAGVAGEVGSADGKGSAAGFDSLNGIAIDGAGNLYVADEFNQTIRKVTPAGKVTTLAGTAGMQGSADGIGAAARFNFPSAVAADARGNVYVTDQGNFTIRKIAPGGAVTTLAGAVGMQGSVDGTGSAARFHVPTGIAVDAYGNVLVADFGSDSIRKVTPAGVVTTLAGMAFVSGSADGSGPDARFNRPNGVTVDSAGNLLVADGNNSTIRKVTPAGVVTTVAGTPGVAGILPGTAPRFSSPLSVTVAGDSIVVTDNSAVLRLRHASP